MKTQPSWNTTFFSFLIVLLRFSFCISPESYGNLMLAAVSVYSQWRPYLETSNANWQFCLHLRDAAKGRCTSQGERSPRASSLVGFVERGNVRAYTHPAASCVRACQLPGMANVPLIETRLYLWLVSHLQLPIRADFRASDSLFYFNKIREFEELLFNEIFIVDRIFWFLFG